MVMLSLQLADHGMMKWAQEQVMLHHYLHSPVDARCSPVAYIVRHFDESVGCLIFGRPESTKCNGWYGSVEDVKSGRCRLTRWEILNLARIWLSPSIQQGGAHHIPNAASYCVGQALSRIVYDYLLVRPPVWMEEPYEIREIISYCDSRVHTGALYRASNFKLVRTNERGIETYVRTTRRLIHAERREIARRSSFSERSIRLRTERRARDYAQMNLFEEVQAWQ